VNNITGGNMFQIISIIIAVIILLWIFMKVKIVITMENELYIDAYIFKFIHVKRYRLNEDELKETKKTSKEVAKNEVENYMKNIEFTDAKLFLKNVKEFLGKVRYDKIEFNLNVNVHDFILNSYILTIINTVIAMLISKNIERINTKNLNYVVTSHEKDTKLYLKCIMYGRIADIIFIIIKVLHYAFKLKKRGNEEDGKGTSNRKFNGDSNVVT
jgi:hypothetical protein